MVRIRRFECLADVYELEAIMPLGTGGCTGATGIHADAWDMAFGTNYDPPNGKCTAYASTDGGVYASAETAKVSAGGCVSNWVFAQSGLHALSSMSMGGIPLPLYQNTAYLFLQPETTTSGRDPIL